MNVLKLFASTLQFAGALCALVSSATAAVSVLRDVTYLDPARAEKLDLYLPSTTEAGVLRPAMVVIHGGGWVNGTKADGREVIMATTYAEAGYVCAVVDYRLGPHAWPTNLHDCKNAVRFLRASAARFQIDPAKIAVHGNSAGGHLALMIALTADNPAFEPSSPHAGVSSRVRAAIDFYGPADFMAATPPGPDGKPRGNTGYYRELESMLGTPREQDPALWQAASPITHVTPEVPAILVAHGTADTVVDFFQSIAMADELRIRGVKHELVLLKDVGHSFSLDSLKEKSLPGLRTKVLQFLAESFQTPSTEPR